MINKQLIAVTLSMVVTLPGVCAEHPNIIVILTDDQGYQDLGCFGSPLIETPNIDKMASEGLRLSSFYVSSSVSSASRAGLLTGQMNNRNGITGALFPSSNGMSRDKETIAEALKEYDYNTACFGKWHLGDLEGHLPMDQGFDTFFGTPFSNDMYIAPEHKIAEDVVLREGYTMETVEEQKRFVAECNRDFRLIMPKLEGIVPLFEGDEVVEFPCDQATLTRRYFDRAIDFVDKSGDEPFFIYITPSMPHIPLHASEQFKGHSKRGLYGDVVEEIDWNVGRLLKHLDDTGLSESTLVVFASDNGPWLDKGLDGGSAGALRGGKFSIYEGGVRVPAIMRWRGVIPEGDESNEIASTLDLFPTIMHYLGESADQRDVDGFDISAHLEDPTQESARDNYRYVQFGNVRGIRKGDYKLLLGNGYGGKSNAVELYNVVEDAEEKSNIAAQHPEKVDQLKLLLSEVKLSHKADTTRISIKGDPKLLLLPIEEHAPISKVHYSGIVLNVRLAKNKVDYMVPLELSGQREILVTKSSKDNIAWQNLKLANEYEIGEDQYRPAYHFAPRYGWMNDPNGMVYKDGEYHLFFQYNPYASVWGNMHWGHAVSRDLVEWEELPVALSPDALGEIYSGSCIVDHNNAAGFGKGAIIAYYTSASNTQKQSMAYSTDNGRTFTKYTKNPIVLPNKEWNFRDPKVIYHKPSESYVMVLAVRKRIEFYTSKNLREWSYASEFGVGWGAHNGIWECPDLVELSVDGSPTEKRWVLIVNINPGGQAGGSGTQYFVGDFDGRRFTCEDQPIDQKWQDWGKDHYATVTWSNAPDNRTIALAWMSNWQYANQVPTKWFRSSNSIARDLFLFTDNGEKYLGSSPSPEIEQHRELAEELSQTAEISFTLKRDKLPAKFSLRNSLGESVDFTVDFEKNRVSVDRRESGRTDFSKSFAAVTPAPIFGDGYEFRIFVDKASVECFINGGRTVLSNLVFPTEPYTELTFENRRKVKGLKIYDIK